MAPLKRHWMKIQLRGCTDPGAAFNATPVLPAHTRALAQLMNRSFQGKLDHVGETLEQNLEDISNTIAGTDGLLISSASYISSEGETATSASLVIFWKQLALLAECMTDPDYQRQGRSEFLIRKSMHALKLDGHKELYLVFTEGNHEAEKLYRKMGFEFLGPYIPERVYKKADELLRLSEQEATDKALRLLQEQVAVRPRDAKAWFELAGAFDFLGRENDALSHYNKVVEIGVDSLPDEDRPRLYIQLGSTLRNLEMFDESKNILLQGVSGFPDVAAIRAFLALTEYSSGNYQGSAQLLFTALMSQSDKESNDNSISDYRRALSDYVRNIDSFP